MKQQIESLLKRYKSILDVRGNDKINKIFLFSGIKPASYYVPDIFGYRNSFIDENAWFVEIWIDGLCIYRRSLVLEKDDDLSKLENKLLEQLMADIFTFGISDCYNTTKQYYDRSIR